VKPAPGLLASAPPPPRPEPTRSTAVLSPAPVTVVKAAARGPAAPPPPSQFLVQLGAYPDREAAYQVQRDVARRFPEARVTSLDAGGGWGVQLGPYAARRSAEARAEVVGRLGYPATVEALPEP